ncbi:copper amine oxidase N-terminal domain-containing protein [Brevibacillus choshinensis]|uniref:copper amine oxidase N-terminal domain-containing protein n=1 Tax=Brevibacillus choshinensis TaxID=54911 RepID=UPI002E24E3F0|nr:stalk domain-containing protein [Brevibacillus choshinensis]
MKKLLTTSLVLALLTSVPIGIVQAEKPVKEEGKGKGGGGKEERNGHGKGHGDNDDADDDDQSDDIGQGDANDDVQGDVDNQNGEKGKEHPGKGQDKKKDQANQPSTDPSTNPEVTDPQQLNKKEAIQKAVKTKKELIELRQQLKHATEMTEELKAKYEELTAQLEQQTELTQALEVQKELLDRFYKLGDTSQYEKLGELYEKAGDQSLKTFVNGTEVEMDVLPFIEKGRALVPVRAISASLKADVNWNNENRTVEVVRGETKITLYLDSDEAEVNGTKVKLETAPVMKNGRVFLPLRFIGEQLNTKVGYQEEGDLIIIEDGQQEGTASGETAEEQPTEQPTSNEPATP